jgi:hypothetical protein
LNIVYDENVDLNATLYVFELVDDGNVGSPFGFRVTRRETGRVM